MFAGGFPATLAQAPAHDPVAREPAPPPQVTAPASPSRIVVDPALGPVAGAEVVGNLEQAFVRAVALAGGQGVEAGRPAGEAASATAVRGREVDRIELRHCTLRRLGTTAVELAGHDNRVQACLFEDLGGAGASLDGGDRTTLAPGRNEVVDCVFRRGGRIDPVYQPAIRLDGVGQVVARNRITDLPHAALVFAGNEHRIEGNEIARVVNATGDAGAVYCGRDWTLYGTQIRGNFLHDIAGTDARYQNGVYLDDLASGIAVSGNVFLRCHWGLLVGGGRDVTVADNLFVDCGLALSFDARGTGWMAAAIADPESSTLHRRLAAVSVDAEPWAGRYPSLRAVLSDRFGRPVGGAVRGNALLRTPLGRVDDRECVRVQGQIDLEDAPAWLDVAGAALRPDGDGALPGHPEFPPIPVAEIGPRGEVGAR